MENACPTNTPADLVCMLSNAKVLYLFLSSLCDGKRDQQVICAVEEDGLVFTVHSRAKSLQVKTSVPSELFDEYEIQHLSLDNTKIEFRVGLMTILDCICSYGNASLSSTSLQLSYTVHNALLELVVEEQGIITECVLQTLVEEDQSQEIGVFEMAFEQHPVVAKLLIKTEALRDAFVELSELPQAATIILSVQSSSCTSEETWCFRMAAKGEATSCEIDFAASSPAVVEVWTSETIEVSYHLATLQSALKAVHFASESYMRINAEGMLSVQHMMEHANGIKGFIDALVSPEDK